MSETPYRAGVIGVGSMGQHHARIYDSLDAVELTGIADTDQDRAESVARTYETTAKDKDALLADADGVSIAVPTAYHYQLTKRALNQDVDVLVEKPFVADPSNGENLITTANRTDATLQVGHVERFNPVIEALKQVLDDRDIIAAHAERLSPPPDREIEDTAVMDLMIHDIDLMGTLLPGGIRACDAVGAANGRYAVGNLKFDSDIVATLTASRVTQESVRRLTFSTDKTRVKADLIEHTIDIHHAGSDVPADIDNLETQHGDLVEQFTVATAEPLERELQSFVDAAKNNHEPRVTGADGLRVVEVAKAIEHDREQCGHDQPGPEITPS